MTEKKVLLLIPKCMIDTKNCQYEVQENTTGFKCSTITECDENCQVYQIKNICKSNNVNYSIIGNSMVDKAIKEIKPGVIIGIACKSKLIEHEHKANHCIMLIDTKDKIKCNKNCGVSKIQLEELKGLLEDINNGL